MCDVDLGEQLSLTSSWACAFKYGTLTTLYTISSGVPLPHEMRLYAIVGNLQLSWALQL